MQLFERVLPIFFFYCRRSFTFSVFFSVADVRCSIWLSVSLIIYEERLNQAANIYLRFISNVLKYNNRVLIKFRPSKLCSHHSNIQNFLEEFYSFTHNKGKANYFLLNKWAAAQVCNSLRACCLHCTHNLHFNLLPSVSCLLSLLSFFISSFFSFHLPLFLCLYERNVRLITFRFFNATVFFCSLKWVFWNLRFRRLCLLQWNSHLLEITGFFSCSKLFVVRSQTYFKQTNSVMSFKIDLCIIWFTRIDKMPYGAHRIA